MKANELKKYGITRTSIDNGYRVPKTYKYESKYSSKIFEVDKDDDFGTPCYVISINENLLKNFNNKTLKWHSLEDAQEDVLELFKGKFPKKSYTTSY